MTNSNHKHGLMLACRHVHVRPHCFVDWNVAYFAGKISKNRLLCKDAVALAYYGSCRLLVLGSRQNIELMTVALTWYVNIFIGCSVTPHFFRQFTSFSDSSIILKNNKKKLYVESFNYLSYTIQIG